MVVAFIFAGQFAAVIVGLTAFLVGAPSPLILGLATGMAVPLLLFVALYARFLISPRHPVSIVSQGNVAARR